MEVERIWNLLYLNRDDIPRLCELSEFMRNCLIPFTSFQQLEKLIPTVIFVWLRYNDYLIEWQEIVQYTSLPEREFKNYLLFFYERFPFEEIREDVIEIYRGYVSRLEEMVNTIKQSS